LRWGIADDVDPAKAWLIVAMETMRNHVPQYVTHDEKDDWTIGAFHVCDTLQKPALASVKVAEGMAADQQDEQPKVTENRSQKQETQAKVAAAMILVRDEPDLSDRQVAKRVGLSHSTLSRRQEYQEAAKIARRQGYEKPKGYFDGSTGNMDGFAK
jgi:hypothetical protein